MTVKQLLFSSPSGQQSFKPLLLSCILGQLISNKKEELTAILDHFNIQVLNVKLCFVLQLFNFWLNVVIIWLPPHCNIIIYIIYVYLFCVFQLDNPVSILNQEMSKQFLHSKNESDKYKVQHYHVIYEF